MTFVPKASRLAKSFALCKGNFSVSTRWTEAKSMSGNTPRGHHSVAVN